MSSDPTTRARGRQFERVAETWLKQRGLTTLTQNYTCRSGEIDLVMREGDKLVFVEVRYRRSTRYGSAAESIDRRKQARIIRAAQQFLNHYKQFANCACRFDVVALSGDETQPQINWIAGAFSA